MTCYVSVRTLNLTYLRGYVDVGPTGFLGVGLADPAQCRAHDIGGICVGSVIDG